mgnify:CR=1 FL=1
MSSSNFNVLRQLAVAADVPTFVRLASSKAFGALICKHPEDEFRRLQRQGYSALVFAALAKGLQLHISTAASAAGPQNRHPRVWCFCLKGTAAADGRARVPGSGCD